MISCIDATAVMNFADFMCPVTSINSLELNFILLPIYFFFSFSPYVHINVYLIRFK